MYTIDKFMFYQKNIKLTGSCWEKQKQPQEVFYKKLFLQISQYSQET